MTRFHEVRLEIVRPGPAHNQLLSPLTHYMALCGEASPVTFHVELEHHKLLTRLERLRYVTPQAGGSVEQPDSARLSALTEVGEDATRVLDAATSLRAELAHVRGEARAAGDGEQHLLHLRLVLGGSELALIPFEAAYAPQAAPGEGQELALQLEFPVALTRETRRYRAAPPAWGRRDQAPRVLLIAAAPAGLRVPLEEHVQALYRAVEPWIGWPPEATESAPGADQGLARVKQRLRVLPDASIQDIYAACAREEFTHVHVLAHGAHLDVAGERRFGLCLCRAGDPTRGELVDGRRLAQALLAEGEDGSRRSSPLVVTLATCDSGQPGSVLVPGGSLAHELHVAGIPWVFASQFPLTVTGSVRLVESLYPRLLRGDDPRQALHETRRILYVGAQRDHDWASLVAYATLPEDFDSQVARFFGEQTRRAVDVALARADAAAARAESEQALARVSEVLQRWRLRLPPGPDAESRARRAECWGIHGATYKRMALFAARAGGRYDEARLREALHAYRRAMEEWDLEQAQQHHWVATQVLSLCAVLGEPRDPAVYGFTLGLAERDLRSPERVQRAWAEASLAELRLLGPYHGAARADEGLAARIEEHCRSLVALAGAGSFPVAATARQFARYLEHWPRAEWQGLPEVALQALRPGGAPARGARAPGRRGATRASGPG